MSEQSEHPPEPITPPHPNSPEQQVTGDQNQTIQEMSGGTAIAHASGPVFNIANSTITNLVGEGTINYQEAPQQIRTKRNHD